jgi:deoxyribodipyrimidine photo-lyase
MRLDAFPPTATAANARIAAIDPEAYARSRNHLSGAVTRLSPYITHGLLDLPTVLQQLRARHPLPREHRLVQEFGWREFFHHVWRHLGEGLFENQRPPVYAGPYAMTLPADLVEARTGVPVIDQAVRELYATGYLHNHARMWLASYTVHLRKVHWRVGADWLYGHLLDGDLASNHLSWQWVAGTFSVKPYLFNAENVARYAPAAWRSAGTVIDCSYEELDQLARSAPDCGPEARTPVGVPPPPLLAAAAEAGTALPALPPGPVQIVHPWSLAAPPAEGAAVAVFDAGFHRRFPWSARRWAFVVQGLQALGLPLHQVDDSAAVLARAPGPLRFRMSLNPGYRDWCRLPQAEETAVPRCFSDPARLCASFSRFQREAVLQV